MMKKITAIALALLTALLAPGLSSYAHAGQVFRGGARGAAASAPPLAMPAAGLALPSAAIPGVSPVGVSGAPAAAPAQASAQAAPVAGARTAQPVASILDQARRAASDARPQDSGAAASDGADGADGAAAKLFDGVAGKAVLLVGTSGARPFILSETARVAKELGLRVYLLDKPEVRDASRGVIPDSDFIAAPIDDHSEAATAGIVDQIAAFAEANPLRAVVTFLNPYAVLAGHLTDRLGVNGNSAQAVETAHTKSLARDKMNLVPEIATPSRVVRSADEARAFYRELGGGKVVMKPIKGGGSQGVKTDIASEAEVAQAFEGLTRELAAFAQREDAGFFNLDQATEIMIERQLVGPEVDVELVIQGGEAKFANVADNAPMDRPHAVEKNSTYPSQLPPPIQAQLIEGAVKAVRALGLKDGNMHVELMMTPEGPRVLEVNARMGGAFVFEFMKDITGISLVEQGWRAVLGLPVDAGRQPAVTIEARFLIAKATGRIEAIEGVEALEKRAGFVRTRLLKKQGDLVQAAADNTFDYIGYTGFSGKDYQEAMTRMMAALESVTIKIRKADGTLVEQTAAYTHAPVDMTAMLAPEQRPAIAADKRGVFGQLKEALRNLPSSFKSFVAGSSLLAMAQEGISIIFSVYGITQLGLLPGILAQATSLLFRIPGSLIGAKWVKRFDAKKIYMVTTAIQGLLLLSLPLASVVLGPASGLFLAHYFFVQVVQGLIYGATRGMAESQIMPKLVGQDRKTLETAGFLWMASIEAFALVTAFGLSPLLRGSFGPNVAMGVFSAIMLSSLFFFKKIKFVDQGDGVAANASAVSPTAQDSLQDKLPWREYIPYVASSFLHFTFYSLFTGVFAKYTFNNEFMSDRATGSYDLGSLAIGLVAAVPALLASLAPATGIKGPEEKKNKGALDRLSLKAWFGVAGLVAAAYLGFSLVGMSALGLLAALSLGAVITINRMKWMASYLSRLKGDRHPRVIAVLNSVSTAAALLPFLAISVGIVLGLEVMPLLLGVVAAVSVVLGLGWAATREPGRDRGTKK